MGFSSETARSADKIETEDRDKSAELCTFRVSVIISELHCFEIVRYGSRILAFQLKSKNLLLLLSGIFILKKSKTANSQDENFCSNLSFKQIKGTIEFSMNLKISTDDIYFQQKSIEMRTKLSSRQKFN